MNKLLESKYNLLFTTIILALYYLALGYYFYSKGIYTNEGLFFAEKATIFGNDGVDKLTIVGLTFPQLSFFPVWAFSFLNPSFAPVIASAIGTAVLFFIIANSIANHEYRKWLFSGILITFLIHPAFVFFGISGKSDYLTLIFFYLFISSFYRYFKHNTSYHISIASIYFTILVFCNFKFIWLALFILPVVFITALQSMQISKIDPWERIAFAFNSISIRRKLGNKTIAVYLIIFALPITALFAFKALNEIYTGDANYFLDSPYANYLAIINQTENFSAFARVQTGFFLPEISFLTTMRILIYAPMILLCLAVFRSSVRHSFLLFALVIFMEFLKIKYPDIFLQAGLYMAFICMCWAMILNAKHIKKLRYTGQLYFTIIILQLITGYFMMSQSFVPEERKYATQFKNLLLNNKEIIADEDKSMASFISNIPNKNKILADDATAYKIIALSTSPQRFLIPAQKTFLTALETPTKKVAYILMPSLDNPTHDFNLLNTELYSRLIKEGTAMKKIQQNKHWILYSLE